MTENFEKTVHISKKGIDNEVTMDLTLHLIYKLKSFQKKKCGNFKFIPLSKIEHHCQLLTCSARADITFPRVVNDLLMFAPS